MKRKFEILVVDDDVGLASSLKDILEGEGHNTAVANDGQTAINLCGEKAFDLALIDILLPDITGDELIKKLIELSPLTEYIIITGNASIETAVEAVRQRQVIDYELKPVLDLEQLLAFIKQVAESKRT